MLATLATGTLSVLVVVSAVFAQSGATYEGPPIEYGKHKTSDPVALLSRSIQAGKTTLEYDAKFGYLKALMSALKIPGETQGLVFSKTSFQNDVISPRNPRSVFFGDEVYLGFVPGGKVLEITAMDRNQGQVDRPRFVRRTSECLVCHGSTRTHEWPGNLVRSVYVDEKGHPRTNIGSFVTTHDSPFEQRWGGWYVTGTHGDLRHMGNTRLAEDEDAGKLDRDRGANVTDLKGRFATDRYLSSHSDIVALMVLEHQTHMHNLLSRANYVSRRAMYLQREANRALGDPDDKMSEATGRVIDRSANEILEYLMFKNEVFLTSPVQGTSAFTKTFPKRGRRDEKGRSLRDFDLKTRLFRYPCSYLIYSPSFDALPKQVLDRVYKRLGRILSGRTSRRAWKITKAQRQVILEILLATKPGVPAAWKQIRQR